MVVIGEEMNEGPALFGSILSVASDSAGHVYVLDGTSHNVRSFDPKGRFVSSAGQSGRGPGDLSYPITLYHDGKQSLYVLDVTNGISVFRTEAGRMTYSRRFGMELRAMALCTIRGRVYVAAHARGKILHEIREDGTIVRSFGERFRHDTIAGVQAQHDRESMRLACDAGRDRFFVTEGHAGRARAYAADGRLLWTTELPDYSGYSAGLNYGNPKAIVYRAGTYSTKSVFPVDAEFVLVQAVHRTMKRNGPSGGVQVTEHGVISYLLSATTGEVKSRESARRAIFVARAPNQLAVAYTEFPFPQVHLVREPAQRE